MFSDLFDFAAYFGSVFLMLHMLFRFVWVLQFGRNSLNSTRLPLRFLSPLSSASFLHFTKIETAARRGVLRVASSGLRLGESNGF